MNGIKITKALVCNMPLTLAPSWISNGHWAIKRSLLNGQATWDASAWSAAMDQVCREYEDQAIAELVPNTLRAWLKTGLVKMLADRDAVLFKLEGTGGEHAVELGIDRAYWKALGCPDVVYSEGEGKPITGAKAGEGTWIVMPMEVRS